MRSKKVRSSPRVRSPSSYSKGGRELATSDMGSSGALAPEPSPHLAWRAFPSGRDRRGARARAVYQRAGSGAWAPVYQFAVVAKSSGGRGGYAFAPALMQGKDHHKGEW